MLLSSNPQFEVVLEAASGEEFLLGQVQAKADVVFMDFSMPGINGAETSERALAVDPDLKIISLSMFGDNAYYSRMVEAGAKGFLLKDSEFEEVLLAASEMKLTRGDAIISVGGGVVGDLGGFAAAVYMRGIAFYNIPTTMLAMVDSSIGGKTAVNLGAVKNIVGAFHQPKAVLVDTDVLKTLPKRHIASGLAEAVKMSLTSDKELFELFEAENINEENIETVVFTVSVKAKYKRGSGYIVGEERIAVGSEYALRMDSLLVNGTVVELKDRSN